MRLPLAIAGLSTAALLLMTPNAAVADVDDIAAGVSTLGCSLMTCKGPLIIRIQRSPADDGDAGGSLKQTRCVLRWTPTGFNRSGQYVKQCNSSTLSR